MSSGVCEVARTTAFTPGFAVTTFCRRVLVEDMHPSTPVSHTQLSRDSRYFCKSSVKELEMRTGRKRDFANR